MSRYSVHVPLRIKSSIEFYSHFQWWAPLSTLACLLFRWKIRRICSIMRNASPPHTIANAAAIGNISTRFAHIHSAHASLIRVPKSDIRLPFGFMFDGTVWHISCLDSWTQHTSVISRKMPSTKQTIIQLIWYNLKSNSIVRRISAEQRKGKESISKGLLWRKATRYHSDICRNKHMSLPFARQLCSSLASFFKLIRRQQKGARRNRAHASRR